MESGYVVVDEIVPREADDVTDDLARESGFASVDALMEVARHGPGEHVYLIRFHYLPPGGWDASPDNVKVKSQKSKVRR